MSGGATPPGGVDPADPRWAVRERCNTRIAYRDAAGREAVLVVWPVAMVHRVDATLAAAWREQRGGSGHFRVERIAASGIGGERYRDHRGRLLMVWPALGKDRSAASAQG